MAKTCASENLGERGMLRVIARETEPLSPRRWHRLGLLVLLAVVSLPRAALASERAFALDWRAPAECPDAAAVAGYVDQVVGPGAPGPTLLRASGTVSRASDAPDVADHEARPYSVVLVLDTGGAQASRRSLQGTSCESVSEAAALVIGLALRNAVPVAAREEPAAPRPDAMRAAHDRPFVAAAAATDVGSLPTATVGLALRGGASWAGLRFEPSVAYFAPRSGTVAPRTDIGARFTLATAGARMCAPFPGSAWWLAPCLGMGVDYVLAHGFGARVPRNASTGTALGRGALLGGWDISRIISVRLELEAVLPLARPEFVVDGVGPVYRRAPLSLRSALGLELHF